MSNITPTPPSFAFSYWRPWKEDFNYFDSFLDYSKDVSLVKYQADTVGLYISQASSEQVQAIGDLGDKIGLASYDQVQAINELGDQIGLASHQQIEAIGLASHQQVQAINELGQKIGKGLDILSFQLENSNQQLFFVNKNLDIQIAQQKVTNILLENIGELLRVPDSEKERQHSIELGLKFFVNAQKDDDLFADALEELGEAEKLMKQDYFVLHRIGLIYMYSKKHINPQIALDYFTRAAKYASVESDPKAVRLANVLAQYSNRVNTKVVTDSNAIESLAADSYEKAAFAAYVLGNFELAVTHQSKAVKYSKSAENYFFLSKYQTRTKQIDLCIQNLNKSIEEKPAMFYAVFKDLDLLNEPEALKLIANKCDEIDKKILKLITEWETIRSNSTKDVIVELIELSNKTYDIKVEKFNILTKSKSELENEFKNLTDDIAELKKKFLNTNLLLDDGEIKVIIKDLDDCLDKPFELMKEAYEKNTLKFSPLELGAELAGGIVFYIDETGKHGLIAAPFDQSNHIQWYNGVFISVGAVATEIGSGKANTEKIVVCQGEGNYAAKLCTDLVFDGYSDWFLPSKEELDLMWENLRNKNIGDFTNTNYWSSSEVNESTESWVQLFVPNIKAQAIWGKDYGIVEATGHVGLVCSVRAVRAFENNSSKFFPLKIGSKYAGGIVFHIDETGKYGLVAAPFDQSNHIQWFNGSFIPTGAVDTEIGTGKANTKKIVDWQGEGNYAAKLCTDLVLDGYSDWFLPSKEELYLMWKNLYIKNIGGFTQKNYWSSSEVRIPNNAWVQYFASDIKSQDIWSKDYGTKEATGYENLVCSVRAIRAF